MAIPVVHTLDGCILVAGTGVLALLSLPTWLLLLFSLLWLLDVGRLPLPGLSPDPKLFGGARQVGSSQVTPVNVLSRKPFFSHFLHGFPVRSSARSPALMAP